MTKEKKNLAFMRPVNITDHLAKIVGHGPLPRTEITKKVWEYIKKHKLQDQHNKRMINPDHVLGQVIGNEQIDMFKMTSKISKHIQEPQAAAK